MVNECVFQPQGELSGLQKIALLRAGVPDEIVYSDGALWARGFRFDKPEQIHYVDRLESKGTGLDTWTVTGSKGTFKVKIEKKRSDVFEQLPRRLQQGRESRNLWASISNHPVWSEGMASRWAESAEPPAKADLTAWQTWADAQKHRSLKQLQDVTASYDRMKATAATMHENHPSIQLPKIPKIGSDQPWGPAVQTYERQRDAWMDWVKVAETNAGLIERHSEMAAEWATLAGADEAAFVPLNLNDPASKQLSALSSIKALELMPELLQQLRLLKDVQGKLRGSNINLLTGLDRFENGDPHAVVARALGLVKARATAATMLRELMEVVKKWHKAKAELPKSIVTLPDWNDDFAAVAADLGYADATAWAAADSNTFQNIVTPTNTTSLTRAYAKLVEEAKHTKDWLPLDAVVEYQGAKFLNAPPLDLAEAVRVGKAVEDAISYRGASNQGKLAIQLANVWPKAVQAWIVQLEDGRTGLADLQKRWDWIADRLSDAKAPKGTSGKGCWAPPSLEQYTAEIITPKSLEIAESETEAWTNLVREFKEVHGLHEEVERALEYAGVSAFVSLPIPQLPEEEPEVMEALDGWRAWLNGAPSAEAIAGWVGPKDQPTDIGHGIRAPKPPQLVAEVSATPLRTQIVQWADGYKAWRAYLAGLASKAQAWAELHQQWENALASLDAAPPLLKKAAVTPPVAEELEAEIESLQAMIATAEAWRRALSLRQAYQDTSVALGRAGLQIPDAPALDASLDDWDAALRDWNDVAETAELHLQHLAPIREITEGGAESPRLSAPTATVSFSLKSAVLDPPQDQWIKAVRQWKRDEAAWAHLRAQLTLTAEVTQRASIDAMLKSLEKARTAQAPAPKWERAVQARAAEAATVARFVGAMRKLSSQVTSYPQWTPAPAPDPAAYREAVRSWVQDNALELARTAAQARISAVMEARAARRDAWRVAEVEWPNLELPWREVVDDLSAQRRWGSLSTFGNGLVKALQHEASLFDQVQAASKEMAELRHPVTQLLERVEASHAWKSALEKAQPDKGSTPADFLTAVAAVQKVSQQASKLLVQLDAVEAAGRRYEQTIEILEIESKASDWKEEALNAVRDRDELALAKVQKKVDKAQSEVLARATKDRANILLQAKLHATGLKQLFGTGLPHDIVARLAATADSALAALEAGGTESMVNYVETRLTGQAQMARLWSLLDTEHSQSNRKVIHSTSIDAHAMRRIDAARQGLERALKERDLAQAAEGRLELQRALSQAMFPKDIERGTMVRIGRSILNQDRATVVEEV